MNIVYPLIGAVWPLLLDNGSVQTDHSGHPLQENVLTFQPRAVHTVTKNPNEVKTEYLMLTVHD